MRKITLILFIFTLTFLFISGFNWPWDKNEKNKTIEITLTESGGPFKLNNKIEIKKDLKGIYYFNNEKEKEINLSENAIQELIKLFNENKFSKLKDTYKIKEPKEEGLIYSLSFSDDKSAKTVTVYPGSNAPEEFYKLMSFVKGLFFNPFSHSSDYSWVAGELYYVNQQGGWWGIVFNKGCPVEEYSGRFVILNFKESEGIKAGSQILIRGEISNKKHPFGVPLASYEVKCIEKL